MKMRIKAGDVMDLIKRSFGPLGKLHKICFGQEAVAKLNSSQVVEDHGAASRIERRRSGRVAGVECSTDSSAYYWRSGAL